MREARRYHLPQGLQLTLCAIPTGPGPALALHLPIDRSSGTARRRRAAHALLVQVAGLVHPPQPCLPCPRMTLIHDLVHVPPALASTFASTFTPTLASFLMLMHMRAHFPMLALTLCRLVL